MGVTTLPPWRMSLPRRRGRSVVEAQAGAFERWGLRVGDRLELRLMTGPEEAGPPSRARSRRPRGDGVWGDDDDPGGEPAGRATGAVRAPGALVLVGTPIGNLGDLSPAGGAGPGRCRRRLLRGHPALAQAPEPCRHHRCVAAVAPRAQRGRADRRGGGGGGCRPDVGPGLGCRHARGVRPGQPGGGRRGRGRPHGDRGPGAVGGAGRAGGQRAAHRPVLFEGFLPRSRPGPSGPTGPLGRRGGHHRPLRGPRTGGRDPPGPGRGVRWRPPGGGGPGADQAARGGVAGVAGRRRPPGRRSRSGARWCWCSGAPPSRPR